MRIARWILPITAAVSVAGLVCAIPASAGWSARVTATGSVTVGQESVTVTPTAVSAVMTNDLYQTTYLVSVTNAQSSTTFAGTSDVTLTALPDSTPATGLGTLLTAVVWPVASAAACTTATDPVPGAVSGAWASGVTSAAVALAPQATALFCVRGYPTGGSSSSANSGQNRQTLASALGSTSGTTSFTPAFRADIALDDLQAQATATPEPITTSLIYPFTVLSNVTTYYQVKPQNILSPAALCLDLRGGVGAGTGSPIDTFTCHNIGTDVSLGNQAISMLPVSGLNAIQLRVRTTATNNGFVTASTTGVGSGVVVNTSNTSNLQQLWIPQSVSNSGGSLLQLVNAATGLCLTAPATAGVVALQTCASDAAMQTYWYPVALPFP
ncbi:hypothetical protein ASF88_10370 [Leifsonia sp. Leaf336]|uniref:hypothetical protein n=1 Tax=Leifsonia sp. Leaf336 TaxID=1736341 RepID=UPI000701567A|nr:hypothetical protein [Leifsonia sp. Leaf336]KQR51988.1 hypothetical protein ASF88_10370 [Leifsonia sp. Leaf336]